MNLVTAICYAGPHEAYPASEATGELERFLRVMDRAGFVRDVLAADSETALEIGCPAPFSERASHILRENQRPSCIFCGSDGIECVIDCAYNN